MRHFVIVHWKGRLKRWAIFCWEIDWPFKAKNISSFKRILHLMSLNFWKQASFWTRILKVKWMSRVFNTLSLTWCRTRNFVKDSNWWKFNTWLTSWTAKVAWRKVKMGPFKTLFFTTSKISTRINRRRSQKH